MLKQTETEKTIGILSQFYHWWHFNWGEGERVPLATPMASMARKSFVFFPADIS